MPQAQQPYNLFNGLVDEIECFGRALTDSEMLALFVAGQEGKCKVDCSGNGRLDASDVAHGCEVAANIEKYWNKPKNSKKMARCASGTSIHQGSTPSAQCPGAFYPPAPSPPAPTGTGYPNDQATVEPCPGCNGVL